MILFNILLYYLVILPISFLPFPILYALSDGLYVLFFYVIGYRKKIVLNNIKKSFPEKSEKEQIEIAKKFYKHFCDLILESIKTFTISKAEVAKRVVCKNPEMIDKYYDAKRSVIIAGGHYNNWEIFAVGVDVLIKHKAVGIYKPLSNLYFDEKMQVTRGRYGLIMLSTKKVKQFFDDNVNNPIATIFAIDQSPSNPNNCYWMRFLNQDTGILFGVEKYAKEYNFPVVYGRINKEKRGHYSFEFFEVTDNPNATTYGEITEHITKALEKDIVAMPQYWLWTHRRWKHKQPENWNEKLLKTRTKN